MTNSIAYALPGLVSTPETIVTEISKIYHVPFEMIYTKCQKREIAESRGMAFFFIRHLLRQSLVETGRPFKTDHATVSYWAKKTIMLTKHDKVHRAKFIDACHKLGISGETTNDFLNEN